MDEERGMLLCTIVVVAAIVGMPDVASAGGGCHAGRHGERRFRPGDATGPDGRTRASPRRSRPWSRGAPVTFVNVDEFVHNVGGNQWGHFDDLHGGMTFSVSFDEAGMYPFACSYHPGMTGAIVVGDGKGAGNGAGDRGRAVRGTGSDDA